MEEKNVVIDTNIFIDHLRNVPGAVEFFTALQEKNNVYFSAITETELLTGSANNDATKREKLLRFLFRWKKVDAGNPLALIAGDLSRRYSLSVPDALIAATAVSLNAELLTRDTKAFKNIPLLRAKEPY